MNDDNKNNEENNRKKRKIYNVNAAIMVFYIFLYFIAALSNRGGDALLIGLFVIYAITLQFIINLIISFVKFFQKKANAGHYLLSALLILLVGSGSCFGVLALFG